MKINKDNYTNIYPNDIDLNLANQKGLSTNGVLNDKYFNLVNNYKYLLSYYLMSKTSLKRYDNEIKNYYIKFTEITKDKMDFYQETSYLELDYLYLRNNLYVEFLSENEINEILSLDINNKESFTKCLNIVTDTYKNIINKYNGKSDVTHMVNYGPNSGAYLIESEVLVIGLRYDDDASINMKDGKIKYYQQRNYIKYLIERIEDSLEKELDMYVKVMVYNKYSVQIIKDLDELSN